jgi:dTDP-4-dehydrorhamnose 3,5-epimerase
MEVEVLKINGPIVFKPKALFDQRGFFTELWNKERYEDWSVQEDWQQINYSYTNPGCIRGLHYRDGEAKLISVIHGVIWDVVVDIRPESKYFGHWIGIRLEAGHQLYIPAGFAHGFQSLWVMKSGSIQGAQIMCLTNKMYNKELSKGLLWNDPEIGIEWPENPEEISEQDQNNPSWNSYVNDLDNRNTGDSILSPSEQ